MDSLIQHAFKQLAIAKDARREHTCVMYEKAMCHILDCDLPRKLIACLQDLDFEARKAAVNIFCLLFCAEDDVASRVAEYMQRASGIVQGVLECCVHEEVFFLGSQILRSAARSPQLVAVLLADGSMLKLLKFVFHQRFEISNEVFSSFRELVLSQKQLAAAHMKAHFEEFFKLLHLLLEHEGYIVQRQALKFLGEMLLDPTFQCIMLPYVQNEQFLQIHMNLLRDRSRTIPLDSFHIFKLFVANPKKTPAVRNILCRNCKRLIRLLETFRCGQIDDGFREDLDMVIGELGSLAMQ